MKGRAVSSAVRAEAHPGFRALIVEVRDRRRGVPHDSSSRGVGGTVGPPPKISPMNDSCPHRRGYFRSGLSLRGGREFPVEVAREIRRPVDGAPSATHRSMKNGVGPTMKLATAAKSNASGPNAGRAVGDKATSQGRLPAGRRRDESIHQTNLHRRGGGRARGEDGEAEGPVEETSHRKAGRCGGR